MQQHRYISYLEGTQYKHVEVQHDAHNSTPWIDALCQVGVPKGRFAVLYVSPPYVGTLGLAVCAKTSHAYTHCQTMTMASDAGVGTVEIALEPGADPDDSFVNKYATMREVMPSGVLVALSPPYAKASDNSDDDDLPPLVPLVDDDDVPPLVDEMATRVTIEEE